MAYDKLGLTVQPGSVLHEEYLYSSKTNSLGDFLIPHLTFHILLPLQKCFLLAKCSL